jgi:hypothetical protein
MADEGESFLEKTTRGITATSEWKSASAVLFEAVQHQLVGVLAQPASLDPLASSHKHPFSFCARHPPCL